MRKPRSQDKVKLGPRVLSAQLQVSIPLWSATPIGDSLYYIQVIADTMPGHEETCRHNLGAKSREGETGGHFDTGAGG